MHVGATALTRGVSLVALSPTISTERDASQRKRNSTSVDSLNTPTTRPDCPGTTPRIWHEPACLASSAIAPLFPSPRHSVVGPFSAQSSTLLTKSPRCLLNRDGFRMKRFLFIFVSWLKLSGERKSLRTSLSAAGCYKNLDIR